MSQKQKQSADRAPEFDDSNSLVVGEWKEMLPVQLTDEQALERNDEATRIDIKAENDYNAAKDAYRRATTHYKGEMLRASELRAVASARVEQREGVVREVHHYPSKLSYTVRYDKGHEGQIVKEPRALLASELQAELPLERSKDWRAQFGQAVIEQMAAAKKDDEELTADGILSLIHASGRYLDSTVEEVEAAMAKIKADSADASENGSDANGHLAAELADAPAVDTEIADAQIGDIIVGYLRSDGVDKRMAAKIAEHVRGIALGVDDKRIKAVLKAEMGAETPRIVKDGRSYRAATEDGGDDAPERTPIDDAEALRVCVEWITPENEGLSVKKLAAKLNERSVRATGGEFDWKGVRSLIDQAIASGEWPKLEKVSAYTYMVRP